MLHLQSQTKRIIAKKNVLHAAFTTSGKGDFFNRVQEVEIMTNYLEGKPKFTVLLGPPSSGKTRFIRHVVEQKDPKLMVFEQAKFFPLFVDLREVTVDEEDWFAKAFIQEVEGFRKYIKSLNGMKLDVGGNVEGIGGGSASIGIETMTKTDDKPDPIKQTFRKLVSIAEKSERPCVLVMDEANKLMALADEKPKSFRTFMDGVVKVTKQDSKMHVVFTSSDSFFHKWLTGPNVGLNGINVKVFVLGDLTKDEAFDYYLSLNPATTRAHFDKNVFPVTGGRMQLIADFDEQERFSGPVKSASKFHAVITARRELRKELHRCTSLYSVEDVAMVFKKLTTSDTGYISCEKLCDELGEEKVDALIAKNILHFRPESDFARDLIPFPSEDVLTATSSAHLVAMKLLLERYESHKRNA